MASLLENKEKFQVEKHLPFSKWCSPHHKQCGISRMAAQHHVFTRAGQGMGLWQPFCSRSCRVWLRSHFHCNFYFICEGFQTQGISWLESWELVWRLFFFIIFYFIKHSAGIQNLRDAEELLTLQMLATSLFSSLFPWKERIIHGNKAEALF